jgi:hypothetical protein
MLGFSSSVSAVVLAGLFLVGCSSEAPLNGQAGAPGTAGVAAGGTAGHGGTAAGGATTVSGGTPGGGTPGGGAGSPASGGSGGTGGSGGATSAGAGGASGSGGMAGSGGSGGTTSGGTGGAGGNAGGGSGGASYTPPDCTNAPVATWKDVYSTMIQGDSPGCGKTCHNGGTSDTKGGGIDLYPNGEARCYGNLVNQDPKQDPNPSAGYKCYMKGKRVVKGNPEMSIVYSKLIGTPICGKSEPQGMADGTLYPADHPWMHLTDQQVCMWYTWIKAGANENGF